MIKKRIPQNYEYDTDEIFTAIRSVLGDIEIHIGANGFIKLPTVESLTTQQKTDLKAVIMPLLTDVSDITQ